MIPSIKNIERIIEYKTPTQNAIFISCILIPMTAIIITLLLLPIIFIRDFPYSILLFSVIVIIILFISLIIWKKGLVKNDNKGLIITSDGIYIPVISNEEEYSDIPYNSITKLKVIIFEEDRTDIGSILLTSDGKEYCIESQKIKDEGDRRAIVELLQRKTKLTIQWSSVSGDSFSVTC